MKKRLPIQLIFLSPSILVWTVLLFFALYPAFALTSGVTVINKRNEILLSPTPVPGHRKASRYLTRNTSFHQNSRARRINDKNLSFAEKNKGFAASPYAPARRSKGHFDPLHAKTSPRAPSKHAYSKKLIQNTARSIAETAPSQGAAAFAPLGGQGK